MLLAQATAKQYADPRSVQQRASLRAERASLRAGDADGSTIAGRAALRRASKQSDDQRAFPLGTGDDEDSPKPRSKRGSLLNFGPPT